MGWQSITRVFYGVPLADNEADRVLGMRHRYEEKAYGHREVFRGVPLSDETPEPGKGRHGHCIVCPLEEKSGRLWVGVQLGDFGGPLPEDRQGKVWSADAPEVRGVSDIPSEPPASAVARWEHFAAWCKRRGVDLPPANICLVADYD
jgi:hypothetical protein